MIVESGPIRKEHTRGSRGGRCHIRLKPKTKLDNTTNLNGFLYKLYSPPPAFHHQITLSLSLSLSVLFFISIFFALKTKLLKLFKLSLLKGASKRSVFCFISSCVKQILIATATCANRSMAFEQYFAREWKSITGAATGSDNYNGCFDCNICLDFAYEPVVTLCGHLYCWPCIYKWLHVQSASLSSDECPQCPVCKADISHTQMVPLYGRGQTPTESEVPGKAPIRGMAIPPRPPACGNQALQSPTSNSVQQLPYRNPYQNQHYNPYPYGSSEEDSPSLLNLGGTGMTGFHHPVVGMFGEMVYARVFGNSESLYTYPNSNHVVGSSNPRLRRQEMQADKSLNRISIFLFCCFLLCLIVF